MALFDLKRLYRWRRSTTLKRPVSFHGFDKDGQVSIGNVPMCPWAVSSRAMRTVSWDRYACYPLRRNTAWCERYECRDVPFRSHPSQGINAGKGLSDFPIFSDLNVGLNPQEVEFMPPCARRASGDGSERFNHNC